MTPRTIDLTVVGVGDHHHDVRVPPGYRYEIEGTTLSWSSELSPTTGAPYWVYRDARLPSDPRTSSGDDYYLQMTDLRTGRAHRATWALDHDLLFRGVTSIAEVAPRVLRFSYDESGTPAKLGVVFQLRSQPRDTPGGFIWEATDSVVADLNVGYLYGFGIIAQMTNGVTASGLRFRAPADSWRTTAGFADPINVHGTYVQLDAKNGVQARFRYMQVDALGFPQFHPGDEIVLVAGRCCARGGRRNARCGGQRRRGRPRCGRLVLRGVAWRHHRPRMLGESSRPPGAADLSLDDAGWRVAVARGDGLAEAVRDCLRW